MSATQTVPSATAPQWELINKVDGTLNTVCLRAQAVLAIFDSGDFYDMASAKSAEAYALVSAAELLLSDIAKQAAAAMSAIEDANRAQRQEAANG